MLPVSKHASLIASEFMRNGFYAYDHHQTETIAGVVVNARCDDARYQKLWGVIAKVCSLPNRRFIVNNIEVQSEDDEYFITINIAMPEA